LAIAYHHKFNLPFVIARFGSAYGLGKGSNLVQTFLRAGLQGETLEVWGAGFRRNQYTFVDDIAEALLRLLDVDNGIFNIISPEETSTGELAQLLQARFGFETRFLTDKPEGANLPYMSPRKCERDLGWVATPLAEGLDRLVRDLHLAESSAS
jgi:nucleoside-diphosphate-sugar epimerase